MIQCRKCGSKEVVEARVVRRGKADVIDPNGPNWKTKCAKCGAFIGYRPAREK